MRMTEVKSGENSFKSSRPICFWPGRNFQEITKELRIQLTKAEDQQLTNARTLNPQAYDLFLKGVLFGSSVEPTTS